MDDTSRRQRHLKGWVSPAGVGRMPACIHALRAACQLLAVCMRNVLSRLATPTSLPAGPERRRQVLPSVGLMPTSSSSPGIAPGERCFFYSGADTQEPAGFPRRPTQSSIVTPPGDRVSIVTPGRGPTAQTLRLPSYALLLCGAALLPGRVGLGFSLADGRWQLIFPVLFPNTHKRAGFPRIMLLLSWGR